MQSELDTRAGSPPRSAPEDLAARIREAAADYEFSTFSLGFRREGKGLSSAETAELRTAVEKALSALWPGRRVDRKRPEVVFEIGRDLEPRVIPAPLYIGARYRKYSRTIPASRWIHHRCGGKGCYVCAYRGTLAGPSVEEIVAGVVLEWTGGESAVFHALGREDTDARMLGTGRPFILEVRAPKRRTIDFAALSTAVAERGEGLADIVSPGRAERSWIRALKEARAEKTYRAWIELETAPPPDVCERVAALSGALVEQYSPRRVMHRKGRHKLRRKRLVESRWLGELDGLYLWEVKAESGTYIKELVTGDEGRTRPSLQEVLGLAARCVALDVLDIDWRFPWEDEG